MASKVDKADFLKIHELKANKSEFENLMDMIKVINQQLQQTIVMLSEAIKIDMSREVDTKNAHDTKVLNLVR